MQLSDEEQQAQDAAYAEKIAKSIAPPKCGYADNRQMDKACGKLADDDIHHEANIADGFRGAHAFAPGSRRLTLLMTGRAVKVKKHRIVHTRPAEFEGGPEKREVDEKPSWMVGLRRATRSKSIRWVVFEPGKQGKAEAYSYARTIVGLLRMATTDEQYNGIIREWVSEAEANLGVSSIEEGETGDALICAMCDKPIEDGHYELHAEMDGGKKIGELTICEACVNEYGAFEGLMKLKREDR